MNICADILQNVENDPDVLENVIPCDESVPIHTLEESQVTKKERNTKE
jgi:hypothetical protein